MQLNSGIHIKKHVDLACSHSLSHSLSHWEARGRSLSQHTEGHSKQAFAIICRVYSGAPHIQTQVLISLYKIGLGMWVLQAH